MHLTTSNCPGQKRHLGLQTDVQDEDGNNIKHLVGWYIVPKFVVETSTPTSPWTEWTPPTLSRQEVDAL
eukprot:4945030-Pleurochrysis_carterae.AAC.1